MAIDSKRDLDSSNGTARLLSAVRARQTLPQQHSTPQSEGVVPVGGAPKRALDLAIAVPTLILLAPVFLFVWIAIRVTMGGPAFYTHTRVTTNGRLFPCIKFRTMMNDSDHLFQKYIEENPEAAREWEETQKLRNDPRISKLGRFLRKSSIDELPQLINVLRNEMSCIGPRPITEAELKRYGINAADYIRTKPGMTGMWQISGRNTLPYDERVRLDTDYARYWSMGKDFTILLKTIPAILNFDRTS